MRVKHINRLNQTTCSVVAEEADEVEAPRVTTPKGLYRFTAAGSRAIATVAPAERDQVARIAARYAQTDDRALRGRIWDCHVALAVSPQDVTELRPGVADESAVQAWRKSRGLSTPAVPAPAAA